MLPHQMDKILSHTDVLSGILLMLIITIETGVAAAIVNDTGVHAPITDVDVSIDHWTMAAATPVLYRPTTAPYH